MFVKSRFFFFFKQKTAYEMRISDWSSDVCSSDLSRKVVPQIMVMATSASSALPKRTLICGWDAIGIEGPRCRSDLPCAQSPAASRVVRLTGRSEEHMSELQ